MPNCALLVGCTRYDLPGVVELWGPANDIPLWRKTLVQEFGFSESNIDLLLGWPDEPARRPTRANIARAFERLIDGAGPKGQAVIVLSGHGAEVPVPENNDFRKNPEPDGLDEVFLPADVKSWTPSGVENSIVDDEIGQWLDRLRSKGADVWIVFDCCHSGTMTRGGVSLERPRSVRPAELGIPDRVIEDAARRARSTVDRQATDAGVVPPQRVADAMGSLIAFYAAQPFEESPELPRPEEAPQVRENYYGLFSYTLTSALAQRQSALTYRELAQLVGSLYRSERKSRPPTAFVEGDTDREVLGLRVWPSRSDMVLTREAAVGGELSVNAGELNGLARGSVLAVHPPAGDPRRPEDVLGYVEVAGLGPTSAKVTPTAYDRAAIAEPSALPDRARCEIVARGLGDLRVKYAVVAEAEEGATIRAAIGAMSEDVRNFVTEVSDPVRAEWWLRADAGRFLLVQGQGQDPSARPSQPDGPEGPTRQGGKVGASDIIFKSYPREPADRLTAGLERDFQKVFRWQNLWRVAGVLGNNPPPGHDLGLRIEVKTLNSRDDRKGHPLEGNPVLRPGQWIEVRLINDGKDDLWVTLLALDSRFGIQDIPVVSIPAKKATLPERFEVTDESFGTEGLIALAFPIEGHRDRPRFDFLVQEPLGRPDAAKSRGLSPRSPFGELMNAVTFGAQTRAIRRQVSTEPQISSAVWVTVPAAEERLP